MKKLVIYTTYNCASCKKAMKLLDEHGIRYEQKNFFAKGLSREDINKLLEFAPHGFSDIISKRSEVYLAFRSEFETMDEEEKKLFIIQHPAILKRPLIVDEVTETLYIGYNSFDIGQIL